MELRTSETKRIMIIYNDLDILSLLHDCLKLDGYDTIIAVDEDETINILGETTPDMVIMDTVTADAHSLHILDIVKNKTNAPIVVITSDNEMETLKAMYEHGADDFIHKPFSVRVFLARVRAVLRRCQQHDKKVLAVV